MPQPSLAIACRLLAITLAALVGACGEGEQRPEEPRPIVTHGAPPFQPPSYSDGRRIDTIVTARIDAAATAVYVVGSRGDSATPAGIDLIEVFALDSARATWTRIVSDSVDGVQRFEIRDITGDSRDDIVARLSSGGNDPVATYGVNIYSADGGRLRRVFRSTWMDPRCDTLPGIRGPVVMLHRALWPLFAPRSDALVYIDDVHGFREGRFRSIMPEVREYFRDEAAAALERYRPLRDTVERHLAKARQAAEARRDSLALAGIVDEAIEPPDSLPYALELRLYMTTALVVINRVKSGDARGARAFWSAQQPFLRSALPGEQFDELAAFTQQLMSAG